jgi:hypothetical protein
MGASSPEELHSIQHLLYRGEYNGSVSVCPHELRQATFLYCREACQMERTEPLRKAQTEATAMRDTEETPQPSATGGLWEIPIPAEAMPVLKKVLAEPPAPLPAPRVQKADVRFLRDSC